MTATSAGAVSLWGIDPAAYRPHRLHGPERTYLESNCYADALIEMLHARGDEPLAMLGFIVATDWEGDQFTYAKPPYHDLQTLYGLDIHEMLPYRPLPEHIEQQLRLRRTVLIEMDAWYLPDTVATSYRQGHLKTTVVPETIDRAGERLRYFHNAGFYELEGDDYRGAFRLLDHFTEDVMDPFTEIIRFEAGPRLRGQDLRAAARELLAGYHTRRPSRNPFAAWSSSLERDLPRLLDGDTEDYHAYAFVTVRMVGSSFELLADHVEWCLGPEGAPASASLREIVQATKVLSFRLARRRSFDPSPALETLAGAWDAGMAALDRAL